jgi:ABC-type glycerol-3-phosphate transport system substrate-binding protein
MTRTKLFAVMALLAIIAGCSTRITQSAGGDATVKITTSTAVQPSTAIGNNPSSSVAATRVESR